MVDLVIAPNSVPLSQAALPAPSPPPAFFTSGNPDVDRLATIMAGSWLNAVEQELVNVLIAVGITPSASDWQQIWQAALQSSSFVDTGSVNALVASPGSPLTVLTVYPGTVITIYPAHTNTGASTFQFGSVTKNVVRASGSALSAGDIVEDQPATLYYNGTDYILQNPKSNQFYHLDSPLIGIPGGLLCEVFIGSGLAMSGNVLSKT